MTPRAHIPPDEDLVEVVQRESTPPQKQREAFDELYGRMQGLLKHIADVTGVSRERLLANVGGTTIEDAIGEVLGNAITKYRRSGGASFKTYVCAAMKNLLIDGKRRPWKPHSLSGCTEGDGQRDVPAPHAKAPNPMLHHVILEVRELGFACLQALTERERMMFVWGEMARFDGPQLADLWPNLSPANIRKILERARKGFYEEWFRRGGEKLDSLVQTVGAVMAEKIDPDKIQDPKAREAYRAWLTSDLAGAAAKLALSVEETRKLLLSAAQDIYRIASLRGRGAILAQVLEIGEGRASDDPLLARARRTIDVVRAAFGFAPLEVAFSTLGSFLQSRLENAAAYEAARRALRLSPGELRRLLSDELEPDGTLFKRLARFTRTPMSRLKALPRRPLEPPELATRGSARLDVAKIRERALARVRRRAIRRGR